MDTGTSMLAGPSSLVSRLQVLFAKMSWRLLGESGSGGVRPTVCIFCLAFSARQTVPTMTGYQTLASRSATRPRMSCCDALVFTDLEPQAGGLHGPAMCHCLPVANLIAGLFLELHRTAMRADAAFP